MTAAHAVEQHRLLSAAHDPATTGALAAAGVGPGWRCLEVGAGNGSVAVWLARRVAPGGSVVATDLAPGGIPAADGLLAVRHDVVRDPLPEGAFDLVHARLVLRLLPERRAVLARLVRALRPGGVLQLDEFDSSRAPVLESGDAAARALWDEFIAAKNRVMAEGGADVAFGRAAAGELRRAGLADVVARAHTETWDAASPGLRLLAHHTRRLRDGFVRAGMDDGRLAAVRALLADPRFRARSHVFYTIQGRRPEGAP
ncbi:class I SAM-dependent methyltransferase [Actinomadura atramentaria]|uniref:class I SAM-dependent methyltransferase n=1 Tax=Actinomadura atramentaria TaxID=1990 RepID=UPI000368B346|nr:class I SAM-dependent methyltransferase [Actinomadura atramentaria]